MKELVGGGEEVEHEQTQRREGEEEEGDAEGVSEYWMGRDEVMERSGDVCCVSAAA